MDVQGFSVAAQWVIEPTIQSSVANQLFLQWAPPVGTGSVPDGAYLTFGHLNPPVWNVPPGQQPTPEDIQSVVVPVMPVARVFVSVDRLREFVSNLTEQLDAMSAQTGQ